MLRGLGQAPPVINVGMRRYDGLDQNYEDEFLRLSITDARDLVVALNYLIEAVERG